MALKSVVMKNIPGWYAPFLSSDWLRAKGVKGSRASDSSYCHAEYLFVLYVNLVPSKFIGIAPIALLRMCVIKIVTLKGGHLMW